MEDTFPLVPDRLTQTTPEFSTNIVTFENHKEQRSARISTPFITFKIVFTYLTPARLQTLRTFFDEHMGSLYQFYFVNHIDGQTYTVRFKNDKFPVTHTNVAWHNLELELVTC
jgi:uncharacterized protein (TIGR02217 family)